MVWIRFDGPDSTAVLNFTTALTDVPSGLARGQGMRAGLLLHSCKIQCGVQGHLNVGAVALSAVVGLVFASLWHGAS